MNEIFLSEYVYMKSMTHSKHIINTRYNNVKYFVIIFSLLWFVILQLYSIHGKK